MKIAFLDRDGTNVSDYPDEAINMNLKFYKVDSSKSDRTNGVYQSIEEIAKQLI